MQKKFMLQGLVLLALYFVVLPIVPDAIVGPFDAINPHDILKLTLVIISISTIGNLLVCSTRFKHAFFLTGFLGGFSSSTATVIAMANLAKQQPSILQRAAAAASASNIATYIQLSILIGLINLPLLMMLAIPLSAGAIVATIAAFLMDANANNSASNEFAQQVSFMSTIKKSVLIVMMLTIMLILIAFARVRLGTQGVNVVAFLSGLVDGHASAVSISELASLGIMPLSGASVPVLVGLTSNVLMRTALSMLSKNRTFVLHLGGALLVSVLVTWLVFLALQVS